MACNISPFLSMSDIYEEIEIDCRPQPPRPSARPRPTAPAPTRRAPVALGQKPTPPPDMWDACDVRPTEFGSLAELQAQLAARLEEALAYARGDLEPTRWDLPSPTWPYTRIGLLLVRCLSLADAITDRVNKAHPVPINSRSEKRKEKK